MDFDYECGICEGCMVCLRDASDFKQQVQRSQAELQARLVRALRVKAEKSETLEEDDNHLIEEDFILPSAAQSDDAISEGESTACGVEASAPLELRRESALAREQLAMACSVRLERLPDDKTWPGKFVYQSSSTKHTSDRAERKTERKEKPELVGDGAETYRCDTCGEQFAQKSDIITHLKKHVVNTIIPKMSSNEVSLKNDIDRSSNNHLRFKPENCEVKHHFDVSKRTLAGEKPIICEICDKQFTQKWSLTQHLRIHTGEKPYPCDICNTRYIQKNQLTAHFRTHTGEKPFDCNVCLKKFRTSSELLRHRRTHTGDKPYTCDICNKQFTQRMHLVSHISSHMRQYSCKVCARTFSHRCDLTKHERVHTVKCFICDWCNKQFKQRYDLVTHIRIHTKQRPYACNVCFKKFYTSSHLSCHKRIHTREKRHVCEICNSKFGDKFKLNMHIQCVHAKLRPFSCEICGMDFGQKYHRDRHHLRLHPNSLLPKSGR